MAKPWSWKVYAYKVLKQVHPDIGISMRAMAVLSDMLWDWFTSIVSEALHITAIVNKRTLSSREIQTAVRLFLPGELAKHAVSEGTKAVTKFCSSDSGSKSARAGLQFPVTRVRSAIKLRVNTNVGAGAPVYLAAVLEYLAAEMLELAGNAARDNRKARINPRHLFLAVANDEELNKLAKEGIIPSGGVLPNIHACLLPKMKSHNW